VKLTIILGFIVGALILKSMQSSKATLLNGNPNKAAIKIQDETRSSKTHANQTLVLTTKYGNIRMTMRPDLSRESVDYIQELAQSPCQNCNLYRAEQNFLLQGIMKNSNGSVKITKGACPPGYDAKTDDCPPEQFDCGCHGPTMARGLVGWAAGDTGPDFFITTNKEPVTAWGQTHTVFGQVQDEASFAVIDEIYSLPTTKKGVTMLIDKIEFTLSME
jgi:cyclophilin family peptidyl-prolyl cis-trans isomerase